MIAVYVDTHAHLTCESMRSSLAAVLTRAAEAHVQVIINVCTDKLSLESGVAISSLKRADLAVFHAAATTPHDVEKEGASFFPVVEQAVKNKQLVAIGETGLDYYYEHAKRSVQQTFLSRYIDLAKRNHLPLIFHCREAFSDLFSMADAEYQGLPAVLHCFTGTLEEVKGVLDRGWFLSLSGIVTFKKAEKLKALARYVPLDRLLIETDSPYLAPQSHRGKQNEPSFLPEVASCIAEIKRMDLMDLAAVTTANALRFFSLPKLDFATF